MTRNSGGNSPRFSRVDSEPADELPPVCGLQEPAVKVVLVTAPVGSAEALVAGWVARGLVACGNLMSVRSVYRWEGAVQREDEVLMVLKVAATGVFALREAVIAEHPYALPEFVVLDVDGSETSAAYLAWVRGIEPAG